METEDRVEGASKIFYYCYHVSIFTDKEMETREVKLFASFLQQEQNKEQRRPLRSLSATYWLSGHQPSHLLSLPSPVFISCTPGLDSTLYSPTPAFIPLTASGEPDSQPCSPKDGKCLLVSDPSFSCYKASLSLLADGASITPFPTLCHGCFPSQMFIQLVCGQPGPMLLASLTGLDSRSIMGLRLSALGWVLRQNSSYNGIEAQEEPQCRDTGRSRHS